MAVLAAGLLAGCSGSPPVELYTLEAVPGAAQAGGPPVVLLREVGLAKVLDRGQVVRSTAGNRVELAGTARWGEPLDAMLGRVLVADLEQRLPGTLVLSEAGAVSGTPQAVVEVEVQRLDAGADGVVVLAAQIGRQGPGETGGRQRTARASVAPTGTDTLALVQAMSAAVGQLADQIADLLRAR